MLDVSSTIVARCTAPGNAPRAVIRLSGPDAFKITRGLTSADVATRGVHAVRFSTNGVSFPGSVWLFPAPYSYTGDDVAELHLPGNALLVGWLIEACLTRGARHAEAGEFTARAFFAGKLTIDQAEGVAATIHAENAAELSAARQLLAGELSRRVAPLIDETATLLALIEVGIDFSEEEVTFIPADEATQRIAGLRGAVERLLATSKRFEALKHEPVVLLAGAANAGKSTLLNALAGIDRVIVSPVAGTTRDLVSVPIRLARGTVKLIDSPGFETVTDHPVASAMRGTAAQALQAADVIVHVLDGGQPNSLPTNRSPDVTVATKADLNAFAPASSTAIRISAQTGAGLDALRVALDAAAFGQPGGGAGVTLNARHRLDLTDAGSALDRALDAQPLGNEHVAGELRVALDALGRISGAVSPDDVIGRVFSGFCIGK